MQFSSTHTPNKKTPFTQKTNSFIWAICITALFEINFVQAGVDSVAGAKDYKFGTGTCEPYQLLGELDGSEKRTMTFVYHRLRDTNENYSNGYLVENVHRNGHIKVWDISDPSNPIMRGEYGGADGDYFMGGHHNYTGIGATVSWNKSGFSQVNLNDIPNWPLKGEDIRLESYIDDAGTYRSDKPTMAFDRSFQGNYGKNQWCDDASAMPNTPWVQCDMNIWYPLGVRRTPMPYGYIAMNQVALHDLRTPNTYAENGDIITHGNQQLSTINILDENGFEGGINIIGNLLIVRGFNETDPGVAIYDISNPESPTKLDSLRTRPDGSMIAKSYNMTTQWNGFFVIGMNSDTGFTKEMDIIDFRDPSNLKHVYHTPMNNDWGWSTRYPQFKDEHMFIGTAKVDMTPLLSAGAPVKIGNFNEGGNGFGAWGSDLLPIGNLLISGGQQMAGGARIYCNEATPDIESPTVSWTWPPNDNINNLNMHIKSRIGLLIHEQLDWNTVNESNFQIRKIDGTVIPAYVSWNDNQTVNVSPKQDLDAATNYELIVHAGGVRDIAGNAIANDFVLPFSTGNGSGNSGPQINAIDFTNSSTIVNTNEPVNLSLNVSDLDGDDLEFEINWGDGQVEDDLSTPSFSHQYNTPGIYTIQITADDDDYIASESVKVVVADTNAKNHSNSSTIIIDESTDQVVNVNPDNNTVTAINKNNSTKIFETSVGADPRSIAESAAGNYWVTNFDSGTISILAPSGSVLTSINLPNKASKPYGIVMDNSYAYVSARASGEIYRINQNSKSIDSLFVGPKPHAMAIDHNKTTLLVTRFISPEDHGEVYKVNLSNFSLEATIHINEISGFPELQTFSNGVPNYLSAITFTPDGTKAIIGSKKDNVRRGMLSGLTGGSNAENTFRSMISMIDLSSNTDTGFHIDIDNREMTSSLTFAHGGQVLYATHRGNNDITAYNANTFLDDQVAQQLHRLESLAMGPIGLAVSGKDLYIHNFLARKVSKTSLFTRTADRALSSFSVPTEANTVSSEQLANDILLGKQLFYSASDTRISKDGYISCAGCHDDGGSDERVWDFTDRGEGLRNTISLKGRAGTGQGHVHWSANFDEIQDFEHDIRGPFGGTGLMSDADFATANTTLGTKKAGKSSDLDALAAYVSSLSELEVSPHRNSDDTLSTNVDIDNDGILDNANGELGKTLFANLGCNSCHAGQFFTDSSLPNVNLHNVGTALASSGKRLNGDLIALTGLDTPTLIGLWESAPYLHNGSAPTILDVLNSASHGGTHTLSNDDRKHLAAYLLQIDSIEAAELAQSLPQTLLNATFDNDLDGFTTHTPNGNVYQTNGQMRADIHTVSADNEAWRIKSSYTLEIENGITYTVCFDARADQNRTIKFNVNEGAGSFARITPDQIVNLTTNMTSFSHTFTSSVQDPDANLEFQFAAHSASVNLDNVKLSKGEQCEASTNNDSDNDGVDNNIDTCDNTPASETANNNGCSASQLDDDNDGVMNNLDSCANTPGSEQANSSGCAPSQLDSDSDGVNDNIDACPGTPNGENVDASGCTINSSSDECNASNSIDPTEHENKPSAGPGDCFVFTVNSGTLHVGTWNGQVTIDITNGEQGSSINNGWLHSTVGTGTHYIKVISGSTGSLQFGIW